MENLFLMEGKKNLLLALKFGKVKTIFTIFDLNDIDQNVDIIKVNEDIIEKLSYSEHPEGVVFICENNEKHKHKEDYHRLIYLDHINDPGNLGTIIRSAVAFNFDGVIVSKNSVDIYNEKVLASSKGSIFLIDVFEDELINYKKDHTIIVTTLEKDAQPLSSLNVQGDFVLVLGNESHGVSEQSSLLADVKTYIPINRDIDSLNVAIAAGIIMNYLNHN